jgi:hypothetical protein
MSTETRSAAYGFHLYDGIPVSDLDGNSMAVLGHYDKQTVFAALDRHAQEHRGWADRYDGLPPAHSVLDDIGSYRALMLDVCDTHGREPVETCLMCDFIGGEEMRLLLVEDGDVRPGSFPVMLWTP